MKITLSKGGTGERTIELSQLVIPDLWHIVINKLSGDENKEAARGALDCWHIAHTLKRELEESNKREQELLEALKPFVDDASFRTYDGPKDTPGYLVRLARGRDAIAKATA